MMIKACLFDLDGVIVDTAKYHFLAWRAIAKELGIRFTEKDNERLKGVSRAQSLEILLSLRPVTLDTARKVEMAERKNALYLSYVKNISPAEILPGATDFLTACRRVGYKTALATASRNASLIVELLGIAPLFDAVVDGNQVKKTKPNPEVFLRCADAVRVGASQCAVFEDAVAGIEAALVAGMLAIGIGKPEHLTRADLVVPGLSSLTLEDLHRAERGKQQHELRH